jgi:hypothetical protein
MRDGGGDGVLRGAGVYLGHLTGFMWPPQFWPAQCITFR